MSISPPTDTSNLTINVHLSVSGPPINSLAEKYQTERLRSMPRDSVVAVALDNEDTGKESPADDVYDASVSILVAPTMAYEAITRGLSAAECSTLPAVYNCQTTPVSLV